MYSQRSIPVLFLLFVLASSSRAPRISRKPFMAFGWPPSSRLSQFSAVCRPVNTSRPCSGTASGWASNSTSYVVPSVTASSGDRTVV